MTMSDGFLARRGNVHRLQRKGDFNELPSRVRHGSRICLGKRVKLHESPLSIGVEVLLSQPSYYVWIRLITPTVSIKILACSRRRCVSRAQVRGANFGDGLMHRLM